MSKYILAIDQGTTSTRAILFDAEAQAGGHRPAGIHSSIFRHPAGSSTIPKKSGRACSQPAEAALREGQGDGAAMSPPSASPTSARRRSSGTARPASRSISAIVWQDRRTADICAELKSAGPGADLSPQKTGLLLDPYFSGTKIAWILDHCEGRASDAPRRGELASAPSTAF